MNTSTPDSNRLLIEQMKGRMDTFEATIDGQMKVQGQHIKQMNKSAESINKSVEKLSSHCVKLFEKQGEHERDIAATKVKVKANNDLCETNKENLEDKIETGFATITSQVTAAIAAKEEKDLAVSTAEDKAGNKIDSNKKMRYGMYLTIVIAVVGWLLAFSG